MPEKWEPSLEQETSLDRKKAASIEAGTGKWIKSSPVSGIQHGTLNRGSRTTPIPGIQQSIQDRVSKTLNASPSHSGVSSMFVVQASPEALAQLQQYLHNFREQLNDALSGVIQVITNLEQDQWNDIKYQQFRETFDRDVVARCQHSEKYIEHVLPALQALEGFLKEYQQVSIPE
ncbi:MAG: hypothetical protein HQM12_11515 [SAR324 cluster bacterium]|nr:hypothetical protein [SAR324 cluster bacterium]